MLISAKQRLGLHSNSGRLVSAQRRLMASVGSLPNCPDSNRALKVTYWNCNGLSCAIKQQQIQDVMEEEMRDIMFVEETHFRESANNDLSAFRQWTQCYKERKFGEKIGSGKMILISNRVNHSQWVPDGAPEWIDNIRNWVRVHNRGMRLAVSVYLAFEVIGNTAYQDWNMMMYGHLLNQVQCLESEGSWLKC